MKPRIFVSSTFYDLKYTREDLANFIKAHDFEPIMFEDGDIGYTPGRALDESCYEAMRSADMVILIIGGQYGSPAQDEVEDDFTEYISVTRKEFRTAVASGVPVFVFIDSKVNAEFGVYESNIKKIENEKIDLVFRAVKNINVFRFIKEIRDIGKIAITEFDKLVDIKEFLSKQWADMFKNYLIFLREQKDDRKLENAVDEMKTLINRMDTMLDGIGKKVLGENEDVKYDDVVKEIEIKNICDCLSDKLKVEEFRGKDRKGNVDTYIEAVKAFVERAIKMKVSEDELHGLYAEEVFKYGTSGCASTATVAYDLKELERLKQNDVCEKVKATLLEEKYYNKIFELS